MDSVLADSRPALSSADFSLRPMFAIKRVPPLPPQPVSDELEELSVEAAPSDEVASRIEGVLLLGIFGSGEVAGAIIRLDNGERQRLPVGESIKGWTLRSLEPRGALFEAATGQQAFLRMAFSTDQAIEEASQAPAVPPLERAVSEQPLGSSAAEVEAPKGFTFEAAYRRRMKQKESGEK
jgi:hypothetical protein